MMHLIHSINNDWIEVFYNLVWYHDILFGHDRCFSPTWQFSIKVFFVEPWLSDNQTDPFSILTLNADFFLPFQLFISEWIDFLPSTTSCWKRTWITISSNLNIIFRTSNKLELVCLLVNEFEYPIFGFEWTDIQHGT